VIPRDALPAILLDNDFHVWIPVTDSVGRAVRASIVDHNDLVGGQRLTAHAFDGLEKPLTLVVRCDDNRESRHGPIASALRLLAFGEHS